MLRRILLLSLAALTLSALVACGKTSLTTRLSLSTAEIQQKVTRKFPIHKNQNDIQITLTNPRVKMDTSKERLALDTDLKVQLPNKEVGRRGRVVNPPPLTGTATVDGRIAWDKATGTISFAEGKLVDFDLEQLPPELNARVKEMAAQSVEAQLASLTLFKLDEAKMEQAAAKRLLQGIKVTDGGLEIEVGIAGE